MELCLGLQLGEVKESALLASMEENTHQGMSEGILQHHGSRAIELDSPPRITVKQIEIICM